jgi:hypothetical protein
MGYNTVALGDVCGGGAGAGGGGGSGLNKSNILKNYFYTSSSSSQYTVNNEC